MHIHGNFGKLQSRSAIRKNKITINNRNISFMGRRIDDTRRRGKRSVIRKEIHWNLIYWYIYLLAESWLRIYSFFLVMSSDCHLNRIWMWLDELNKLEEGIQALSYRNPFQKKERIECKLQFYPLCLALCHQENENYSSSHAILQDSPQFCP